MDVGDFMEQLLQWMEIMEDTRQQSKVRHSLKDILAIVLFATLASLTKLSGILVLGATGLVFLCKLLKNRNKNTFIEIFIASVLILIGISIHTGPGLPDRLN